VFQGLFPLAQVPSFGISNTTEILSRKYKLSNKI
jgi:hypothetical protein